MSSNNQTCECGKTCELKKVVCGYAPVENGKYEEVVEWWCEECIDEEEIEVECFECKEEGWSIQNGTLNENGNFTCDKCEEGEDDDDE
jgi:hypothetical protein